MAAELGVMENVMDLNRKKAFLGQYGELDDRIVFGRQKALGLREDAEALSAVWGEHIGAKNYDAPYVRKLEEYEEECCRVERDELLLDRLREQMEKCFSALPDHRMRWIMQFRWVDRKPMTKIADLMFMDRSMVYDKFNKAMDRLVLPEDPIDISKSGSRGAGAGGA